MISTYDVAPDDIAAELLKAETLGERKVLKFVKERLQDKSVDFYSTVKRINPKTLETKYQVKVNATDDKEKTVKADRAFFQRLLVAAQDGRILDMRSILDHELAPVPLSLVSIDSKLNKCNKADLADITTEGLDVTKEIPNVHQKTCVTIEYSETRFFSDIWRFS